ncbi:MAG: hypothetical protein NUV78_01005 [Candidatus Zambryskibacteria bacterium]|nr:hypothetical protein [Candidatus Zambryskibacteria bacterium]
MNEENQEFNLEPVEIHPEMYGQNLFGETMSKTVFDNDVSRTALDTIGPKARGEFNIFAFTDAIGSRNKKEAWVLYQKALASGMVAEEIFFKVFWQVKTMLLASRTKSAEEADMKAYPYSKAKGFLKNFKEGELEKFSEDLIKGYHEVRRGNEETETFVEKMLLKL